MRRERVEGRESLLFTGMVLLAKASASVKVIWMRVWRLYVDVDVQLDSQQSAIESAHIIASRHIQPHCKHSRLEPPFSISVLLAVFAKWSRERINTKIGEYLPSQPDLQDDADKPSA